MKAITVEPKRSGSIELEDVAEPNASDGSVLVQAIAVGVWQMSKSPGQYGWRRAARRVSARPRMRAA